MVILGRALPLHHSPPPPTTFVVVVDVPPPPHSLNRPHTTKRTRTHPNTLRQAPSPTRPRRHRCRPSPPPPNNVEEERERRGTLPERPTRLCGAAFSPAAAAIYALNNTRRPLPAHKRRQRLPLQPPFPSPPTVVAPLKRNQSLFPPAAVTLVLDTQPPVTPKPANGGHQRVPLRIPVPSLAPRRPLLFGQNRTIAHSPPPPSMPAFRVCPSVPPLPSPAPRRTPAPPFDRNRSLSSPTATVDAPPPPLMPKRASPTYQVLPFDFNRTTSPLPAASAAVDAQPPLTCEQRTLGGTPTLSLHHPTNSLSPPLLFDQNRTLPPPPALVATLDTHLPATPGTAHGGHQAVPHPRIYAPPLPPHPPVPLFNHNRFCCHAWCPFKLYIKI
ncbi:hypothetical protein D9619_008705 [Psilocybe cf. subviscida]|uniref:Uncharacterized protein n=1 Tax=Psilocybe cf. subviscida TaxID=2480587 RepID=A0A8H5F0D3_9AGAR|nr:hypothetical protein D9619_008705 [Psilocybe cf. subviscida]